MGLAYNGPVRVIRQLLASPALRCRVASTAGEQDFRSVTVWATGSIPDSQSNDANSNVRKRLGARGLARNANDGRSAIGWWRHRFGQTGRSVVALAVSRTMPAEPVGGRFTAF